MTGFTAADAVARIEEAIQRPVDVVIANMKWPTPKSSAATRSSTRSRWRRGRCPAHCELVGGEFWTGRHRPARSPAAGVRGLERPVAAAAG